MIEKKIEIVGESGIHARLAALLVQKASEFTSETKMTYNGKQTNLKSIMGVMSLGVPKGSQVTLQFEGSDEMEALQAILDTLQEAK